jgi:hypothetical protein
MNIPGENYRRLPDDPLTYILTVQRCEDGNLGHPLLSEFTSGKPIAVRYLTHCESDPPPENPNIV